MSASTLGPRSGRFMAGAASAVVLVLTAACSSGTTTAQPLYPSAGAARTADAEALLVQCALSRNLGTVLGSAQHDNDLLTGSQKWLSGDRLKLTGGNYNYFNGWFQGPGSMLTVSGNTLGAWDEQAGRTARLPVAVCGDVSARKLHDHVFAAFPLMLSNDPWTY